MTHPLHPRHLAASALLALSAICARAHAQEVQDLARMSIEELASLEVTSVFKRPEAVSRSPSAIYVITAEQIQRSGAATLPEVLRLAPNLEVARLDSGTYAVSARGFNTQQASDKLLVLVDGRSVYTPLHAGVYWDQYQVPLNEVERIEVISGPGGTLWGANAVNGVINVITKSAWTDDGGEVIARGGTLDDDVVARYAAPVGGSGAVRFYGHGYERGPMRRLDGADANDDWRGVQGGVRSDWHLGDSELTVQGDAFRNYFDLGDIDGANVLARWSTQRSESARTELQVYVDTVTRDVNRVLDSLDSADIQFQQSLLVGGSHRLVWGAGHRVTRDEFDNDLNFFVVVPQRDTVRLTNVFLQDSLPTGANSTLTIGAKVEDSSFSGTDFLPSARWGWQAADKTFLWAAVSRAVRTPSRLDRDLQAPNFVDPNPDFGTEKLIAYEAGFRGQPVRNASLSVSIYYNDYDDLRMLIFNSNRRFQQANAMHGYTYGLEAWSDIQVLPWWRLTAGINALEKHLRTAPNAFVPVLYQHAGDDPSRQYWLRSSMDIRPNLDFDLNLRAVDELPDPRVDSYVSLDARLAWRVSGKLQLSIAGANLLDSGHAESGPAGERVEVPRSGWLEVDWRF